MSILDRVKKSLAYTATSDERPLKDLSERDLINAESAIGRELFGPIPDGHRREFFCLDEHTWIWYEEWTDGGKQHLQTTRYEIRETGIMKATGSGKYKPVTGAELENLIMAMQLYYEQVLRGIYELDPRTGRPITD